ncbi:hypothetical protein GCM10007964_24410 [Sphaerisporangium melleum]|uniref:Uncharacterized protein n=1 Tax=Sphaerisporangium melleum TaxID=321316 RepID=A0A917QZW3_9ACTN|nr:hypothetical protein GCM10007964_24410 [Sphaerisporangium melleum]
MLSPPGAGIAETPSSRRTASECSASSAKARRGRSLESAYAAQKARSRSLNADNGS